MLSEVRFDRELVDSGVTCLCQGGGLRAVLLEDLDRYVFFAQIRRGVTGRMTPLQVGLTSQGLWATMAYRLEHYARYRLRSRLLRLPPAVFHRLVMVLTGIRLDAGAHIGPGLKIPHGGRIEMGPVRIGENCDIFQGVTVGESMTTLDEDDPRSGVPTLGDRVWVGPGAVIAGELTVGDDAVVGANSLLVRDVPPLGVVLGVPARLVSRRGSFAQILYRGMDNDDKRKLALAEREAGPARIR
jgi:serine O-acetyltransferase